MTKIILSIISVITFDYILLMVKLNYIENKLNRLEDKINTLLNKEYSDIQPAEKDFEETRKNGYMCDSCVHYTGYENTYCDRCDAVSQYKGDAESEM